MCVSPVATTDQLQSQAYPPVYLGKSHPSPHPESSVVHAWQYRIIYCYVRRDQLALGKLEKRSQSQCCPLKHSHIQLLNLDVPRLHLSAFVEVEPERSDHMIDL